MGQLAPVNIVKSLLAAMLLPLLITLIMTGYTLMLTPSAKGGAAGLLWYYLLLTGLFSMLTPLNNSILTSLVPVLRLKNIWLFSIAGGLLYGAFFTLLTSGEILWRNISEISFYGFGLGAVSSFAYFYLLLKPLVGYNDKPVHWLPNLVLITAGCLLTKLFIAQYKPASNIAIYLATKTGPSFSSYLATAPHGQTVILEGKDGYIGEYYFDLIFQYGWWVLPLVLVAPFILAFARNRKA